MSRGIFLIDSSNSLVEMREQPYDSEALLQQLLADHPGVLAGNLSAETAPSNWLLIAKEIGIPDAVGASDRWNLDHLFLDGEAIPTLVEVKRSSDRRIRREVVGQMLDYAANALVHWPADNLKQQFEQTCRSLQLDSESTLRSFLGEGTDPDEFWSRAKTNLQAGRIRLAFVADAIPPELNRIIEFLNAQMDPAEVIGIEVRQYVGAGVRTLVPTILGQTAESQKRKAATTSSGQWDADSFLTALQERAGSNAVEAAEQILKWATDRASYIYWGKGSQWGSFVPVILARGAKHQLFAVYTSGTFELYFQYYAGKPPFASEAKRRELLNRINAIPKLSGARTSSGRGDAVSDLTQHSEGSIPLEAINRRPSLSLAALFEVDAIQPLLSVFDWMIEEIRSHQSATDAEPAP